jgi:ABC-2 type transport system ATP-binding protein
MTPAEPAVTVNGAGRRFDEVIAVANVSFEVPAGSILGIIGPSGSGKTTTIRMLMGSLAPSEGTVRVLGEEPTRFHRDTRERIGYMPQAFVLYPDLTAGENVDFVASLYGLFLLRRRRRTRRVLELLDLWDVRKRRASALSGGMQRRLELACALVHEPSLLVLDEPTAGIDPILRRTVWDELHRLRDAGVTALVTTQYVTEAEECDQVALISEGRLIAHASPVDLRRRAYGGDMVEVATTGTFDAAALASSPSIRGIRQTGLRDFRAIVDDAATALPELVDTVTEAGAEVASAREVRPSFEEVFTELVEADARRQDGEPEPVTEHAAPSGAPAWPPGEGGGVAMDVAEDDSEAVA